MIQETSAAKLLLASGSVNRRAGHVLLVDDDLAVVMAFRAAIEYEGYRCSIFDSASALLADRAFLAAIPTIPTCILTDVKMPGLDGLELQRELPYPSMMPLVFISGASGAAEAAAGFRGGAMDFLVKPVELPVLLAAVEGALARSAEAIERRVLQDALLRRMETLTPREAEVAKLAASGATNQEVADQLGIALRTVKYHRHQAMEKLGADSLAALVRMVDKGGI
jgi:FixJ family two-component response regulator